MSTNGHYIKSKAWLYLMAAFYGTAGLNHFIHPNFYLGLIPPYLAYPEMINYFSGFAEITLAIGLLHSKSRKAASWLIIVMLIAFIPSHIHFIQIGACITDGLCVSAWVAWLRLLIIHPLLILWAFQLRKY